MDFSGRIQNGKQSNERQRVEQGACPHAYRVIGPARRRGAVAIGVRRLGIRSEACEGAADDGGEGDQRDSSGFHMGDRYGCRPLLIPGVDGRDCSNGAAGGKRFLEQFLERVEGGRRRRFRAAGLQKGRGWGTMPG